LPIAGDSERVQGQPLARLVLRKTNLLSKKGRWGENRVHGYESQLEGGKGGHDRPRGSTLLQRRGGDAGNLEGGGDGNGSVTAVSEGTKSRSPATTSGSRVESG